MALNEIVDGFKVTAIHFDTKLKSIDFTNDSILYRALFNANDISLIVPSFNSSLIAEFNLKTKKAQWYIDHCCGASGFDLLLGDNCYGCNDPKIVVDSTLNSTIVSHGKHYSKRLLDVLTKELLVYKYNFENVMK